MSNTVVVRPRVNRVIVRAPGPQGPPGDVGDVSVTSVAGRTGDVTLTKGDVGLANVDNTADASKPVSTAQAAADTAVGNAAATALSTHAAATSSVHGISAFGATLVDDASASEARTTLGLGTAATAATGDFAAASHTHTLSNLTQSGATTGQVAQWNGTAWVPATAGSSVMKPRWNSSTTSGSTTVTIPLDNTIPQSSEGIELITLAAVTPSSASNTIAVELSVILSPSSLSTPIIALFLDSNTNASAATYHSINTGYANIVRTCFLIPSWSGSKDIKIRIGAQAGTLHWNKSTTTDLMGGVSSTVLVATELAV